MTEGQKTYISFDIGGTMIKYGILDEAGHILEHHEKPTQAYKGGNSILEKISTLIEENSRYYDFSGICIATAGMVDPVKGSIIFANDSIPGYTGMELKKLLEAAYHIPCEVENDVSCAALSEVMTGAGKGSKISLCLTVGTGIGGCIIIDDKIFHGASNSAGEVGYMKVLQSDFQKEASTSSLIRKVAQKKKCEDIPLSGIEIFDMAKAGDADCKTAIEEMCDVLGYGIANICYVINPEVVILGGGIMKQKDYLYDKIRSSLDKYLLEAIGKHTRLEFATNGNLAGMLGAYYNFKARHIYAQK